jgi:hypothetical protein
VDAAGDLACGCREFGSCAWSPSGRAIRATTTSSRPDALAAIRGGIAEHPERVLLFRMDNYGTLRWRGREIRYGNMGTPMVVVPNDPARLPSWRFGDYEFIRDSCKRLGEPVWREDVVAVVRPYVPR